MVCWMGRPLDLGGRDPKAGEGDEMRQVGKEQKEEKGEESDRERSR